jgi:predicted N-acetyltransferase YhbS
VRVGDVPVVFLGPLAVEGEQRSGGVGGMLVERACEAARAAGEGGVRAGVDGADRALRVDPHRLRAAQRS